MDLTTISLGAGVQSTVMYLMACHGELGPKPDAAIFADVQAEPYWVYTHLDWLEKNFGRVIPIHRVTYGNLTQDILISKQLGRSVRNAPFFTLNPDGGFGMLRRQCTERYKATQVIKEQRLLLGLQKGQRAVGRYRAETWIGISKDEAKRAKPARDSWIEHRHPLLDAGMSRVDCLIWMKTKGYPEPERSACTWCPYHCDTYWMWMRDNHPEIFEHACWFDETLRERGLKGVKSELYIHDSRTPLRMANLRVRTRETKQMSFECEGMCGV